jgi:hypothetical protein
MRNNEHPAYAKASAGEGGFIRNIVIIVGALVALKYFFDFDLIDLLTQGKFKEVIDWLRANLWQKFVVDMVWPFIKNAIHNLFQFFKNI